MHKVGLLLHIKRHLCFRSVYFNIPIIMCQASISNVIRWVKLGSQRTSFRPKSHLNIFISIKMMLITMINFKKKKSWMMRVTCESQVRSRTQTSEPSRVEGRTVTALSDHGLQLGNVSEIIYTSSIIEPKVRWVARILFMGHMSPTPDWLGTYWNLMRWSNPGLLKL